MEDQKTPGEAEFMDMLRREAPGLWAPESLRETNDVFQRVMGGVQSRASQGTEYADSSTHASALRNSNPAIRRIAGRVFPSLATRSEVNRGVYSAGTLRGWLKSADAGKKTSGFGVGTLQLKSWGRWAVGVGVLTTLSFSFFTWKTFLSQEQQSAQATYRTYETRSTQLASYQLPDGSSITLAPESRMRFNTEFGNTSREVFLEGSALFTVTRSSGVPFVVRTRTGSTTVLGTTFSIREYATDPAMGIVVAEGKVAFRFGSSSASHNTILTTGDLARVANAEPVVTHGVDVSSMLAWTSGRLVFTETPLRDAIPDIKRWYGLDVIVTDSSLLSATITGSLSEKTPFGIAIALARAIQASVRITGQQMVFSPLEPR